MMHVKFGIRELVIVALLIATPLASWWFVFRPRNELNTQLQAEIQQRQAKLRELNQLTGTIGDLQGEIAALEDALKFFRSRLPSEKEIDKVLQEIWKTAEGNHLVTKSIRTLDRAAGRFTGENGPHAEQPIAVELEGDFLGFYSFLQALEIQPRIMRIQDMKLARPQKSPEGHTKASFVISIFFEENR